MSEEGRQGDRRRQNGKLCTAAVVEENLRPKEARRWRVTDQGEKGEEEKGEKEKGEKGDKGDQGEKG